MIGHWWDGPQGGPDLEITVEDHHVDLTLVTEEDTTIRLTPEQAVQVGRALLAYATPHPTPTPLPAHHITPWERAS